MESKKKLFFWDLARYLLLFLVFYPIFGGADFNPQNPVGWAFEVGASEFLTNDGHVWGDFVWIFGGIDLRGQIWLFSMLAIVVLDYFWVYKNWEIAKKLRIFNWIIALGAYAGYTIFFPQSPQYDYFIFAYGLSRLGWPFNFTFSAILSLVMMWLGVILISGWLIYKSLQEENSTWAKRILFLLSMGIPGFGHIAIGKIRHGVMFMALGLAIWTIDFYLFFASPFAFIPTLLFWLYAARDASNKSSKQFFDKNKLLKKPSI